MKNPEIVAHAVIKLFLKKNKKVFEEFYKIELKGEENVEEIVNKISEKKSYLLKGGKFDEHRTIMVIVRDWQQGRLKL